MAIDLTQWGLLPLAAAMLAALLFANEMGRVIGLAIRRRLAPPENATNAVGFVTGGLLTLFAFVLGIALSMASSRLEARRDSVLNEANAIGTVWLRAGLAGGPEGAAIRRTLRDYVQVRIAQVRDVHTEAEEAVIVARTGASQTAIWREVETLTRRRADPVTALLVSAVNDMFDLSLTNRRNFAGHVPPVIVRLLMIVSVLAVGAIGYQFGLIGTRQAVVTVLLLVVWTTAIVLVLDIDDSRGGQVRVSAAPLIWTAEGFGPDQ